LLKSRTELAVFGIGIDKDHCGPQRQWDHIHAWLQSDLGHETIARRPSHGLIEIILGICQLGP
jgi:hypothetical protein